MQCGPTIGIVRMGRREMSEYISREAALAFQDNVDPDFARNIMTGDIYAATKDAEIIKYLNAIPAADVRPVERGNWTRFDYVPVGHDYECSKCGYMNDMMSNYCPNCGADMREVEHD